MKPATAVQLLKAAGALVAIGGYLSQPQNLGTLSPGQAHAVAAVGALAYIVGQALEHYLTAQQVNENTAGIAAAKTKAATP